MGGLALEQVVDASALEPPAPLLVASNVRVAFGGLRALDGASVEVPAGGICGLIGPNGAGKTTLFNCITRLCTPDAGAISFDGRDLLRTPRHRIAGLGIVRTFQNLGLFESLTVRENVALGAFHRTRAGYLAGTLQLPSARREQRRLAEQADSLLAELGLADVAGRQVAGLPYGTLKRVELTRALAAQPRLLLLDEPASGLMQGEVRELASLLVRLRVEHDLTLLLVEHHMGMVMEVCEHVVVLEEGRTIAAGPAEDVRSDPWVVDAYLGVSA